MVDLVEKLRLYVVLDRDLARGRDLVDLARAAVAGGAGTIQVRGKDWTGRELFCMTRRLKQVTAALGALLVVNDRVDVALAAGADGVHLGQDDLPAIAARALLGPGRVLGISVQTEAQAQAALAWADYVSVSPVFVTPTKPDAGPGLGLKRLRRIAAAVAVPVVAIGGITPANAAQVAGAGAAGLAVVSAVVGAEDVTGAARALLAQAQRGWRQ